MVIGICGGSGSGKTTLLKRLSAHFKELKPSIFTMDNYYRPITSQVKDENGIVNFDLPTALDENKLVSDLTQLVNGESIEVKEYRFNTPPNKNILITIAPSELLIIEGLFLFEYPKVKEALDFSIFIDVDLNVQLDRRLYRDQETRGYSREDIMYQWNHHVLPCYQNFLEPYVKDSDFIFRNDEHADEDFNTLVALIESKIK